MQKGRGVRSEGTDALGKEIDEINARLDAVEAKDREQDGRLDALEEGGETPEPPDPPQPSYDYPDETNSGCSGSLTNYTGPMWISENNTVIENKRINGDLGVGAKSVKLKNCEVNPKGPWGIDGGYADGMILENVTVNGPSTGDSAVYLGDNGQAIGCKFSKYVNGLIFGGGTGLLEDCLIYNLRGPADGHFDGAVPRGGGLSLQENGEQVDGIPQDGVIIRHNTIISRDTSCIFMKPDFGPISNVTIEDNQLLQDPNVDDPTSYTIYSVTDPSMPPINGVKILNNKIQKGRYGYADISNNEIEWSGNVDYDTGQPIPQPAVSKQMHKTAQEHRPVLRKKGAKP